MPRPVIGICTALEQARFGPWTDLAALTPFAYVAAVQRADGLAVLLPPDPRARAEDADPWLDRIDGLILAGGIDMDPSTYGAERHPETGPTTVLERDEFELALAARAMERDLPLLGICRGMQVMNVATGGTLHQHIPDVVGHFGHRRNIGTFADNDHLVALEPGSRVAEVAGETTHRSYSHHHQAVKDLGDGFVGTGTSVEDGLIEAFEAPGRRFALGVQWHPEADETSRVIAALVEEARRSVRAA